ncbi:MAG: endonuclease III [Elusimicrobiota bacterium]
MENKNIAGIISLLKKHYPKAECSLDHHSPFELLIATILSAQCTDERVNMVTPFLFNIYPGPKQMGQAPVQDLETMIRSTGFYHSKALSIKEASKALVENFGGKVPVDMDKLHTLRCVARKTANVVLQNAFNVSVGVVVDTHVGRLARRLGLTKNKDAVKIEKDLIYSATRKS